MSKTKLSHKDLYEEIGKTYRYYLNWRHALFAGYLIVLYAVLTSYINNQSFENLYISIVVIITIVFWMIEIRIRDLYQACTKAGEELEQGEITEEKKATFGIYGKLENLRKSIISHSRAIDLLYTSVILGAIVTIILRI